MLRRDFLVMLSGCIATHESFAFSEESLDNEPLSLVFDDIGISEADRLRVTRNRGYTPTKKKEALPFWAKRDADEFRMDVATVDGYNMAKWLLRDVQANKMGLPDMALLSFLSKAQTVLASLDRHSRFDLTSGMRTPSTNGKTEGASHSSLHLPDRKGAFSATDFRASGFDAAFTAKLMKMVGMGGVGLYQQRDFVHADTGRKRQWVGK